MKKRIFCLIFLSSVFLTTSCGDQNVLTDYSNVEADEAIFYEAQQKLNASEWDSTIDLLENELTPGYFQKVKVKELLASAYAGKCGFTFLEVVMNLTDATTSNIFPLFLELFSSTTLDTASCDSAIGILTALGTVTERTNNQNLHLTILGMARVGTTLASKLDPDTDGVAGAAGVSYDICEEQPVNPALVSLTDNDVKKVSSGVGLIFENISALSSVLDAGSSSLGGMQTALGACQGTLPGVNCTETNAANVSPELVYIVRLMMDTGDLGFGACDISTPATCCPGVTPPIPVP